MKYILMNKYMDVTLNISLKKKLENHLLCQYPFTENLGLKFFNDSSRDYRMSTELKQVKSINSFLKKGLFPVLVALLASDVQPLYVQCVIQHQ